MVVNNNSDDANENNNEKRCAALTPETHSNSTHTETHSNFINIALHGSGGNNDVGRGETAWLYSGGGFSSYFDAPKWQINAINDY